MRSKHFLGLCLAVGSFTAAGLATGCGGSATPGTGGAGGGDASTTTTTATSAVASTTTTTTSTTATTATSGTGGSGPANGDFATATDIDVNPTGNTADTLPDADTTTLYYKFTGKAGERITVVATAQGLSTDPNHDPNDNTTVDLATTVYDSSKKVIAQNDDAWPRLSTDSQLFTVLPADGDYYVGIAGCETTFGGCGADVTLVTTLDFEFFVADVDHLNAPEVNEATAPNKEPNDDTATPSKFTYKVPSGGSVGQYGTYIFDGDFKSASDVDVFELDVPADTLIDKTQRGHAEFWVQPVTNKNGTGSVANAKLWLVDAADATMTHIAEVDQVNYSDGDNAVSGPIAMSVPVTAGSKYYLFVAAGTGTDTPIDSFYFMKHFVGSFNYGQFEGEGAVPANDTLKTAQGLTAPPMVPAYFVDGDLTTPADVDYFSMAVPAGMKKVSLFCDAQRAGSGLRNAKFSLLKDDGSATGAPLGAKNVLSETPDKDVVLAGPTGALDVTAGATIYLRVEAGVPSTTVNGRFYHCSVEFQ